MIDWDIEAQEMFKNGGSYSEIAAAVGRDKSAITKMAKERKWVRTKTAKSGRKAFKDCAVKSAIHRSIGIRIAMHRVLEQENVTQLGKRLKKSRVTVSHMEQGFHDFTLNEISQIADLLDTNLMDLLLPLEPGTPIIRSGAAAV